MPKRNTRSPLKGQPLHNPAESLEQRRSDLIFDHVLTPLLITAAFCVMAFTEWWGYLTHTPRQPQFYTLILLLAIIYSVWRIIRVKPELSRLRLGIQGEKAVGQYLERLREQHYQVFHDVGGPGFNLDHVLIGPAGIFTVETKTLSKPTHRDAKIVFDGEGILVDGHELERNPVVQARAEARWLRELLKESTGRTFDVRPVVVFPGWWIEQRPGSTRDIWVLEPKALPGFLSGEPPALVPEDVKLASFHLSRFAQTQDTHGGE
ncbi:MAG: nuclease-related domain-containing protein [Gammaproteobacteria bacterium]